MGSDTLPDAEMLAIARRTGTPCYLYDLAKFQRRVEEILKAFTSPDFRLLFATMANPHSEMLEAVAALGVGACVNSVLHLVAAIEAGISIERIQFSSTGISGCDMRELLKRGVRVNLDSPRQVARWFGEIGGVRAGIRLNAASLVSAPKERDRIGIPASELQGLVDAVSSSGGAIEGVHVYVGTNFRTADEMLPVLDALFVCATKVPALAYVNIGGGIGVDYAGCNLEFDLQRFGQAVSEMHSSLERRVGRQVELFFEPGRGLAAGSGVFLSVVTDVKSLHGETFVAVDGSIAVFPRPFHHPNNLHRVRRLSGSPGSIPGMSEVVVVGRTTFSRDILARCNLPSDIDVGDVLLFEDAGAYCSSMASRFLGQQEPASLYLNLR